MNKKDFNPDINDEDLLVDLTFKAVKFIISIVAVLGVFIVFGRVSQDSQNSEGYTPITFTNVNPNIPASEIKSRDYTNRTVTYREYGTPPPSKLYDKSDYNSNGGFVIKANNGVEINTGLTRDDIIQQVMLDADIHDLVEYYGDELR